MADSAPPLPNEGNAPVEHPHPVGDSSLLSSTFGTISDRLHQAVQTPANYASSSVSASSNPANLVSNGGILMQPSKSIDDDDHEPSETESITTDTSAGMMPCDGASEEADEVSILEAKIQILYGQLHTRNSTIEQLRAANNQTRQDFELFEKENVECMEELCYDIQDLKDKLQEKEDRVCELESLQVIPEHLEGQEEIVAELEKMNQQLRAKDQRICELEESQGGIVAGHSEDASVCAELREELEATRRKLKEKGEMLEAVEESECLNFSLVEERDEEIERLNEVIANLEANVNAASRGTGGNDDHSTDSDATDDVADLEAKIQQLQDDLDEREEELDALKETSMQDQEELEDLGQQLATRDARIEQLETANRLNEELIRELEKLEARNEKENADELQDALEERDAKCKELQTKVDGLSQQLDLALEQIDDHELHTPELKQISELLEAETSRCELLDAKLSALENELKDRNSRIFHLGFDSDVELIEALQDTEQELQRKERDLAKLRQEPCPSDANTARAIPTNISTEKPASESRLVASADDPKSIEALLVEEKTIRQKVKSKVKSLTSYLQKREFDDDSQSSAYDMHELYFHLAQQIRDIVVDLSARDGVGNDLIKAFQLKLEYTASIEKALSAREVQIEMLVQELEEQELYKDNLNTSINSIGSNNSLLFSTKLDQLLVDLHERDEKLKVLEWLTVDLSKTLEAQTEELEEVKEKAAGENMQFERKIDQLLSDVKKREVEVQSFKQLVEAEGEVDSHQAELESRLAQEVSQREGLQDRLECLTNDLKESEMKITCLEAEVQSRVKDAVQKEELQQVMLSQEAAKREDLQAMADSLTAEFQIANKKIASLEFEVESKMQNAAQNEEQFLQEASQRKCFQAEVNSLTAKLAEAQEKNEYLQAKSASSEQDAGVERQRLSQELSQREGLQAMVESLTIDLKEAERKIACLEAEVDSKVQDTAQQGDRLSQEVSQRECLQAMIDSLTIELKGAEEKIACLEGQVKSSAQDASQKGSRLSQEVSQRVCLQAMVGSLTTELQEDREKIDCLEDKLKLSAQDAAQKEGLQALVDSLALDFQHAEKKIAQLETVVESKEQALLSQQQERKEIVASLTRDKMEAEGLMKQLEDELEAKNSFIRMREIQLQELSETEKSFRELSQRHTSLENDKRCLETALSERDDLLESMRLQRREIDKLVSELHATKEKLRDRYHQVATLVCVSEMAGRTVLALEKESDLRDDVLRDFEQEIDTLLADVQGRDQRIEELIVEKETALDIAQAKEDEFGAIPFLENQVQELGDKNHELLCELDSQGAMLEKLRHDLETRTEESAKHVAAAAEMKEENAKIKCALETQVAASGGELSKIQSDHADMQALWERKVEDLRSKNEGLVADLKIREDQLQEAAKFASQMEELKALNDNLLADLEGWEVRVNELERVVAAKDDVFQEMTVIEQLLEDQKSRTQDLLLEIDTLTNALEEKESELAFLKADTSKREQEIDTLKASLEQKESELDCLKAESSKQHATTIAELETHHEKLNHALKKQVEVLENQCREHKELSRRHEDTERELAGEIESLLKQCKKNNELEHRFDLSQRECERLNEEVSGLIAKCQDLTTSKEESLEQKEHCAKLQIQIGSLHQELEEQTQALQHSLSMKEKELDSLKEENEDHQAIIKEIESLGQDQCQDLTRSQEECLGQKALCAKLQIQIDSLHQELEEQTQALQCSLSMKEKELDSLKKEHEDHQAIIKELQSEIESLGVDRNHDIQTLQASLTKRREELESLEEENLEHLATIEELEKSCEEYAKKEQNYHDKNEDCVVVECQLRDVDTLKVVNEENQESEIITLIREKEDKIQALQSNLYEKDQTIGSLQDTNEQHMDTIKELKEQCNEYVEIKQEYKQEKQKCAKLQSEVQSLADIVRRTNEVTAQKMESIQKSPLNEATVREEVQSLRDEVEDLNYQLDKLSHEKAVLVDSIAAIQERTTMAEEQQLQQQQQLFSQLSDNMESVAQALEEREKQLEAREEDNRLKDAFVAELQNKIDQQSKDVASLIDEHEHESSELREKLDALSTALKEKQHAGGNVKVLEESLRKEEATYKAIQAENEKVRQQLEAIGFSSMDELVRGLAMKCQEHKEMENAIMELDVELTSLRKDLEKEKEKSTRIDNGGFRKDPLSNKCNLHVHKIRELEMKIDIFREEIAGKNAIIEDLTLRLNGESIDGHDQDSDKLSQSSKDAPGLRMKRVAGASGSSSNSNHRAKAAVPADASMTSDDSAAKTAKALATIPQLINTIKERDATIGALQQEIATSKRAIEGLARGLEYNVQEKIEADKLVHEKQTECSMFASKVQQLSKQLKQKEKMMEKLEKDNRRAMKRNLASYDEIKALSVNELVDLLRQSRLLSEDLEQERERLIANATNMSIALAESRNRVDDLMGQLEPEVYSLSDHSEPGRIHSRANSSQNSNDKPKGGGICGTMTTSPLSPFWGKPTRKSNQYSPL
ncbi:conserved hypothetical protein [Seminavis robusta]|uniref:Uncharacterized protein n=1 Tax=Seminavis robusta TaxID=568900 RepID=A0A9N8HL48_9STRA|nr:conserved hypothetical protein [Seminavis robusta]|eukprot:Sro1000_g229710.1 conserved hypothetical protein (2491) ;mRNA; r:19326-26798